MKKVLVILLFIPAILFAKDLEVNGYGNTIEEAKAQAIDSLSEMLYGNYISSKSVLQRTPEETSLISKIQISSCGRVYGLDLLEFKEDLGYRVTARIEGTENLLDFYDVRMRILESMIDGVFYNIEFATSEDIIEAYISSALIYASEYEACALILLYFDRIPELNINYSREVVFNFVKNKE